jgi:hypothetical protein
MSSRAGAPPSPRALPSFQAGCSRQRESSSMRRRAGLPMLLREVGFLEGRSGLPRPGLVPPRPGLPRAVVSALLVLGSCGLLQRCAPGGDGGVPGHPAGDDDVDPAQQGSGAGGPSSMTDETLVSCPPGLPGRRNQRSRATAPHPTQHQDTAYELDDRPGLGSIVGTAEAMGRIGWQQAEIPGAGQADRYARRSTLQGASSHANGRMTMHSSNARYSAFRASLSTSAVRCLRPCKRPECSWGGGRGCCGPGRSASWYGDRHAGRRSAHPAGRRPRNWS